MKPYGLNKMEIADDDCGGFAAAGRATGTHNIKKREYHSLRKGKRAQTRRYFKRRERMKAHLNCQDTLLDNDPNKKDKSC